MGNIHLICVSHCQTNCVRWILNLGRFFKKKNNLSWFDFEKGEQRVHTLLGLLASLYSLGKFSFRYLQFNSQPRFTRSFFDHVIDPLPLLFLLVEFGLSPTNDWQRKKSENDWRNGKSIGSRNWTEKPVDFCEMGKGWNGNRAWHVDQQQPTGKGLSLPAISRKREKK